MLIEWTTHGMTGIAVGYLLTSDWTGAVIGGASALLPDIDDPRSRIGRPFFFLAIPIHALFGHRTLTHSIGFVTGIMLVLLPFWPKEGLLIIGLLTHIAGDLLTGKVQVLYPFRLAVGLSVSRSGYWAIDRMARVGSGLFLLLMMAKDIFDG